MVNLAHDVDISQEPLLRLCARHLKSSGHVCKPTIDTIVAIFM